MTQRLSQAGKPLAQMFQTPTVAAITDGDHLDVTLTANAGFIFLDDATNVDVPIHAAFVGAPLDANLGILGAWVSNPTTGVVKVRFCALSANSAQVNQPIYVEQLT